MPRVQVLFFSGCPHYQAACELVRRIADDLQVDPEIELVEVRDAGAADELRFLGSPSVRVDGHDVEPGADDRDDYALSCRIYRTPLGLRTKPDEAWIREALGGLT